MSSLLTRSRFALLAVVTVACSHRRPESAPAPASSPSPPAVMSVADADLRYLRKRELMVPVAGVRAERIPDSFNEARSGGRKHNAVDILAPRGTPVLAADDGRLLRISKNSLGGNTLYAVDSDDRFVYYYAHLDRYAKGLHEGMRISKGQLLGYVGTTGNAPKDTPHLHFQMMRIENDRKWWDGPPVDPKLFLVVAGERK